ncbi:MAG TPA: hypothetical protein GX733_02465 [Tissierellia bacterium]|jgi:hypothetical protein|nr:hypothetical protein [Tissierellia bacterium]
MLTEKKRAKMYKAYFNGQPKKCFQMCKNKAEWDDFRSHFSTKEDEKAYVIMQSMDEDAQDAFDAIPW